MVNIIDYISETDDKDYIFIRGHLYLESLMSEIIKKSYVDNDAAFEIGKMFYNKVKLLKASGIIDDSIEKLLLEINKVRNKMAHDMNYHLTFDDFYRLVCFSCRAGVDYSDDSIEIEEDCKEYYFDDTNVGVTELVCNTFQKLVYDTGLFTDDEISNLLC